MEPKETVDRETLSGELEQLGKLVIMAEEILGISMNEVREKDPEPFGKPHRLLEEVKRLQEKMNKINGALSVL